MAAATVTVLLTREAGSLEGRGWLLSAVRHILRVVERIEPVEAGSLPASTRVGWLDPAGGRARWTQWVERRVVAETLVERGRVSRYLLAENAVIVGTSCRAFASGCAELADPIDVYRRALQAGSGRTTSATVEGRRVYVVTLPVQDLPDALRIRSASRSTADVLPLASTGRGEECSAPRSSRYPIRKVLGPPGSGIASVRADGATGRPRRAAVSP